MAGDDGNANDLGGVCKSNVKMDIAYNFNVTIKVNQINKFFSERCFN